MINSVLGFKLISVKQRPTIIGRYDNENQNVVLRHTLATQTWDTLPVKLPRGKSDFALLQLPNNPNIGLCSDTKVLVSHFYMKEFQ